MGTAPNTLSKQSIAVSVACLCGQAASVYAADKEKPIDIKLAQATPAKPSPAIPTDTAQGVDTIGVSRLRSESRFETRALGESPGFASL